jgi:hypothetical protein
MLPPNMKITERHEQIIDLICKSFHFASSTDRQTVITKQHCSRPTKTIQRLKEEILNMYPKEYTKKLSSNKTGNDVNLTILRQLLKAHNKKLLSKRLFKWDSTRKKSVAIYQYKILA